MRRNQHRLWSDVDALQRLARAERSASLDPSGSRTADRLLEAAFPPFENRRDFRVHLAEAPMTLANGDYCDAFLIAPETLAVIMADVSGKGVSAAVVRGVTRSVVRNISPVCASPGELLARLERILGEAELGSMFVTVFVGWYDTRTGQMRYANAGHPVPFVISRQGEVRPFGKVTAPILGILGTECYEEGRAELEIRDRLVLYTDGVTEARNADDEFFGSLRLTNLLTALRAEPLERMGASLVEAVHRFQADRRQDDVSLLLLERCRP